MPCMTCGRPLNVCHGECGCKHQDCGCHHGGQPATQYLGDLPIDDIETTIDYIIGERDVEDTSTGNTTRTLVRVAGGKLFPNANMDNIISLVTNNTDLTVPSNTVRAVYIENNANTYTMKYADASHSPVMLALGASSISGEYLVQNAGFVNIPAGHDYTVGMQYYLGASGAPTTDSSVTGVKLFIPISKTRLAINM